MKRSFRRAAVIESLESRLLLSTTVQSLGVNVPTYIDSRVTLNGIAYFEGRAPGATTDALWRSDGTAAGTYKVKDLLAGANIFYLTVCNNTLFYQSSDGSGRGLWSSDGTTAGTYEVRSFTGDLENFASLDGTLYFNAYNTNDGFGRELWKSDGSSAGTVRVADISTGTANTVFIDMYGWNHKLYFGADDGNTDEGIELYVSDGTAAGTKLLKDLYPGSSNGYPVDYTPYNGKLYFSANDAAHGSELWETDGTAAGTKFVKDFLAGKTGSYYEPAVVLNDGLYGFTSPTNGLQQLWKIDASDTATMIKQFATKTSTSYSSNALFWHSQIAAQAFVFSNTDETHGVEPWVSDGTSAGTHIIKELTPGATPPSVAVDADGPLSAAVNGIAFFNGSDPAHGSELWQSDGTAAGTTLAADLISGSTGSRPQEFFAAGDSVLFSISPDGSQFPSTYALYSATVTAAAAVPTANAGSGYNVAESNSVTLDGSASAAGSGATLTKYEWDLNYDGATFTADATGVSTTFSAAALDGPSTRTVALRVTNSAGKTAIASTIVSIIDAAPTATFTGNGTVALGSSSVVTFSNAADASAADVSAGFTYSYDFNNDGDFTDSGELVNSSLTSVAYQYSAAGTYTVHGRIRDKDNGFTDYTTAVTVTSGSGATTAPTAPSSLAAKANSGTQVTLTWADNATNESTFTIQRSASSSFSNPSTFTATANATNYVDTTTAKSTYYYYRVGATNAAGTTYSKSVKIKTLSTTGGGSTGTTLATPTGLTGTAVSGPGVSLKWTDNAASETGYEIEVSTVSTFASLYKDITVATPNLAAYTVTGLPAKTYYYFRVRAISSTTPTLDSVWSSSVKIKTLSA